MPGVAACPSSSWDGQCCVRLVFNHAVCAFCGVGRCVIEVVPFFAPVRGALPVFGAGFRAECDRFFVGADPVGIFGCLQNLGAQPWRAQANRSGPRTAGDNRPCQTPTPGEVARTRHPGDNGRCRRSNSAPCVARQGSRRRGPADIRTWWACSRVSSATGWSRAVSIIAVSARAVASWERAASLVLPPAKALLKAHQSALRCSISAEATDSLRSRKPDKGARRWP